MTTFTVLRFLLFPVLAALLLSCTDEPTAPPPQPPTPDTTSHAVSWTIVDTLGDRHSCFFDVCAINDTCVYAVGMMFMGYDSSGTPIRYNVARWDGTMWHRMAVQTGRFDGAAIIDEMRAVFAFSPDDIWMTSISGGYAHWNGQQWESGYISKRRGLVNRIFGFSPDEIYFFCSGGGITRRSLRYSAEVWEFIESGTTKDINDAWGVSDTIIALACNIYTEDVSTDLIQIVDGKVSRFSDTNLDNNLRTIWFSPTGKKVVAGSWYQEWQGDKWWGIIHPWEWVVYKIRGNHDYDLWEAGAGSTISHYNGVSWYLYPEIASIDKYKFHSLACTPNNVWVVGGDNADKSVIFHGRY